MKQFAGNCIDGPWRGRKVEQDVPMFRVAVARNPTWEFRPDEAPDPYLDCDELWYVWVYSLGEWAIVDKEVSPRHPRPPHIFQYLEDVQAARKREAERLSRIKVC